MEDARWERMAALGGVAFVVLTVVGIAIAGQPPTFDDSPAEFTTWFHDHAGALELGQLLTGLGLIGLAWWFGTLWRMMVAAEDGRPRLAIVAALGLASSGSMALVSGVINSAMALRVDEAPDAAKFFYTMSLVAVSSAGFGAVVFLGAVCALSNRARMWPQWITVIGWLAALGFLLGTGGSASDETIFAIAGFVGFVLWAVWVIAISMQMWQRSSSEAAVS
jgi:hypothetical protein